MTDEVDVGNLVQQQKVLGKSLKNTIDNLKKKGQSNLTRAVLSGRLRVINNDWYTFRQNHALLEEYADDDERKLSYFADNFFGKSEEAYLDALDYINERLGKTSGADNATTTDAGSSTTAAPRAISSADLTQNLPKIQIPTFSGNFADWQSFHDLFTHSVASNTTLSNVQKLYYLKNSLTGEAARMVKNVQITDANYTSAWKSIKERYNNKRAIANAQFQEFFNLPAVNSDPLTGLKALRDVTTEMRSALEALKFPVSSWDSWIVYFLVQRMDKTTRSQWEMTLGEETEYPTYANFNKFLQTKIRSLEVDGLSSKSSEAGSKTKPSQAGTNKTVKSHYSATNTICVMCQANHALFQCQNFRDLAVPQRESFATEKNICKNCLTKGHALSECKSKFKCKKCHRRHHTLLHRSPASNQTHTTHSNPAASNTTQSNQPSAPVSNLQPNAPPFQINSHVTNPITRSNTTILLATVCVRIQAHSGQYIDVHALLDQGSESTFVSESIAQTLRLPRERMFATISGLGGVSTNTVKNAVTFGISPCNNCGPVISVHALVLKKITSYTPRQLKQPEEFEHLRGLNLSEGCLPYSNSIDLLIGADYYGSILKNGLRSGLPGTPTAQLTIFGWVISGPTTNTQNVTSLHVHHCETDHHSLNDTMRAFWELEECPQVTHLTDDEKNCETHFETTHSRVDGTSNRDKGKYIVRIPFKESPNEIGSSRQMACASFSRLENKLQTNKELETEYSDFLNQYERLGHMHMVDGSESVIHPRVYLPHHPVLKDSTTSRVRVVFNASAPTSNGRSLNDYMHTGPKLQTDLPAIVLNWCCYRYAFTADIEKMFRQILVDPCDRKYQCILWRSQATKRIETYELATVTYGMKAAPYLAIRVLRQLAIDEGHRYPLAVPIVNNSVYVDDAMFGADTIEEALEKRAQVTNLFAAAGFTLRKWASSDSCLLEGIPRENHGLALEFPNNDVGLKVLGILWTPGDDSFRIKISLAETDSWTKRGILSAISKIFDPLGWVTPVVIVAKIFLQSLWTTHSGWDDAVSPELHNKWLEFYTQLPQLEQLRIPRWNGRNSSTSVCELHGFSDASSVAYAAVVYLRVVAGNESSQITLLTGKSKVAPIKTISVPRLELCGAVLLTRLMKFVQDTTGLHTVPTFCWTDSTVTLGWIRKSPSNWKTFVANRVSDIHTRLPNATWKHVPTADNPADCASRGISPTDFVASSFWFEGPTWLKQSEEHWPEQRFLNNPSTELESKSKTTHLVANPKTWELVDRYSSWAKLLRITAYILRFVYKLRVRRGHDTSKLSAEYKSSLDTSYLNAVQLKQAMLFWVNIAQREAFSNEINALLKKRPLDRNSPLVRLDVSLDEFGTVRLGGRLHRSLLHADRVHPAVLPKHRISELIIDQTHKNTLHGGVQLTLRVLHERFWILGARSQVKTCVRRCVTCARYRQQTGQQFLAELPTVRVTPSPPFAHTGVDYAGPLSVKTASGRGHRSHKAYIALFVCLSTRAIHVELVHDYSTAAFLAAFERFSARRGVPSHMYSDNGTNFQGADKELHSMFKQSTNSEELRQKLADDGTSWHFIPPAAPHFGGLWEAGVKSVKHHLRRMLQTATPTAEELSTLLCKIESCLNSRPIAPLRDDPESFDALTPGHFLVGRSLKSVPAPSLLDVQENRLSRWQSMHRKFEQFWRIWQTDYLNSLQQRYKWQTRKVNLKLGDLVLIKNNTLPPSKWELCRVTECHTGTDQLVRVVTVKTAQSSYKRPITQLCKLPIHEVET